MAGTTLDAGALIGLERGEPRMQALVDESVSTGAAGVLCGRAGTADVVDASLVIIARARGGRVVTGDPEGLAQLDGGLELSLV